MQILFVMLIFPLIMNAAQYWIIDNFIKDRTGHGFEFQPVGQDDDEDGRPDQGLMQRDSEDVVERGVVAVPVTEEWRKHKEANGLPPPLEFETDDEENHALPGSSGSR